MNQFQHLKLATNQQTRKQRANNMGESLRPLRDKVILTNLERGERLSSSGIVILDDDGKDSGIRARWAQVYAVGPEQKDVNVGDWVLMQHGRWTVGADLRLKGQAEVRFWRADVKGMLGVSETRPPNISVETIVDVAEDYSKMNVKSTKKI